MVDLQYFVFLFKTVQTVNIHSCLDFLNIKKSLTKAAFI